MYPSGIIYNSRNSRKSASIYLHAPFKVRLIYSFLRALGGTLMSLPVVFVFYTVGPAMQEEAVYAAKQVVAPLATPQATPQAAVVKEFSLVVPKIDASAKILPNVNPANEKEYLEALKEGVAHAAGTHFPGQGKNIFLFSHSTNSPWQASRLRAIFYLLHKLEKGDEVIVFYEGQKYQYKVEEKKVVSAKDVSWIEDEGSEERLILQTCTPPGTTLRRLLVIAKPVDNATAANVE